MFCKWRNHIKRRQNNPLQKEYGLLTRLLREYNMGKGSTQS